MRFQLFGAVRVLFSWSVADLQESDAAWRVDLLGARAGERRGGRDILGKGLRVIPRGKQRLTVYRAHQVGVNGSEK